ncbi:MAG TPA: hypothetical protein VGE67_19060, partial [Haloferula sp.]
EIAVNYISKLTNEGQQSRIYNRMLDGWLRRDYNAASQWISQNSLPADVAQRLQRRMQEMQQRQQ